MNEQKKILFYEEGFFEKSIHEYDPILSSYLDDEKKRILFYWHNEWNIS